MSLTVELTRRRISLYIFSKNRGLSPIISQSRTQPKILPTVRELEGSDPIDFVFEKDFDKSNFALSLITLCFLIGANTILSNIYEMQIRELLITYS